LATLKKPFKPKKDITQDVRILYPDRIKRKGKLDDPRLVFKAKEPYHNRHSKRVELHEGDQFICDFEAKSNIIRAYYNSYRMKVKANKIVRDYTTPYIQLSIGIDA
jgi:hypothetical protein